MLKTTQLIVFLLIFANYLQSQQIIAYTDNRVGISLNADQFISPEIQIKIERHSLLTNYYMIFPSAGFKVRYVLRERGSIYTGAFASSILYYNINTKDFAKLIVPDIHIIGFEVYPFDRDFAGFIIYIRTYNFDNLEAQWAITIKF